MITKACIILQFLSVDWLSLEQEMEETSKNIDELQKEYIDISVCAAEELNSNVEVKKLRYSLLCLPPNLKKEHSKFVRTAEEDVRKAESAEDIMYVVGKHHHYLHYSLLKYVIGLYGSVDLKNKMADYVKKMDSFCKKTKLQIFSEVCADEPEKVNGKFATMDIKHDWNWQTVTLEDVEKFRIQFCRELSLYDFSLNLLKVARGCVEVIWRVPRSLVTYIQNSIKPSSQSMMEHCVTTLTIDGFIVYDSCFGIQFSFVMGSCTDVSFLTAMQYEDKVKRLQYQAISSNISYLVEELSIDEIVPHLIQRRLLTEAEGKEVLGMSSQLEKVYRIVQKLRSVRHDLVGTLPTLCTALLSARQPHVAERLHNSEFLSVSNLFRYLHQTLSQSSTVS